MILEAFAKALVRFEDPWFVAAMLAGLVVGLIVGIIPGLGAMIAIALALPFIFTLPPEQALAFIGAISATGYIGGCITAVLLNIPGTSPNAATLIDGFPMTQKGQGGRALGAALMASGTGNVVTTLFALATVPLVMPLVLAIRSADMVFIILMGLSFIAVLGAGSMVKGLISGGLGLLLSFVGLHVMTGIPRFTFGNTYLYDGFGIIPVSLGIFALPEAIDIAVKGGRIAEADVVIRGMHDVLEGAKDVFRHWGLWLRCNVIGYVVGVIPGVGAETATFVAYGQAKQTSKHPERFGTGIVEGVIAPETANNAKEGGALLTTLALGVPGSAVMVVILAALMMVGLTPGPSMLTEHLDLSLALLLNIAVSGVIATALCFLVAPQLAKIGKVPAAFLFPSILVITFVASFVYQRMFNDVIMVLVFGALGYGMRKFGYNRPALFLGFVLGVMFEKYLFIALNAEGPLFFLKPISLGLILITVALFCFGPATRRVSRSLDRKGQQA